MTMLSQPDENMIPGQTYTFQFLNANYVMSISTDTLTKDITSQAPNFIGNVMCVNAGHTQSIIQQGSLSTLYNIQFTYQGDGSDVILDVANELTAAVKDGSNDSISFVGAVADTASSTDINANTIADAAAAGAKSATDSVSQGIKDTLAATVGNVTKQAASSAQDLLTPIEIAVGILALVIIAIIFTSGKSGGVSGGPEGVKIG